MMRQPFSQTVIGAIFVTVVGGLIVWSFTEGRKEYSKQHPPATGNIEQSSSPTDQQQTPELNPNVEPIKSSPVNKNEAVGQSPDIPNRPNNLPGLPRLPPIPSTDRHNGAFIAYSPTDGASAIPPKSSERERGQNAAISVCNQYSRDRNCIIKSFVNSCGALAESPTERGAPILGFGDASTEEEARRLALTDCYIKAGRAASSCYIACSVCGK